MAKVDTRPRKGSPLHITPAFDLFKPSYRLVRQHLWIFGPLAALPLIFQIHDWIWTPVKNGHVFQIPFNGISSSFANSTPEPTYAWYSIVGFSLVWFLIVVVAGTIFKIMSQQAQLEVTEGKSPHFARLWQTVKELGWRMVGLYLLVGLYIVVGLILLIIPGLIMIRRYFLAPYVMLDKKCSIREAMDQSAAMSKPNSGAIWGIIGVTILFSFVTIVPILGWLVSFLLSLFYSVAPALRYQELKKIS